LLGLSLLTAADTDKPAPLRYLRPQREGFALESEVTTTTTSRGTVYVSRTSDGDERLTLTLHLGEKGQVLTAEAVVEKGKERKKAFLDLRGPTASLKRGGATELFEAPANPIVTSAPD